MIHAGSYISVILFGKFGLNFGIVNGPCLKLHFQGLYACDARCLIFIYVRHRIYLELCRIIANAFDLFDLISSCDVLNFICNWLCFDSRLVQFGRDWNR